MRHLPLPLASLFLLAAVVAWAGGRPGKAPPSLAEDLKKLQGTWKPVQPIEKVGYLHLEFGKALKDGTDYLAVVHAVDGGGKMLNVGNEVVRFELKEEGKQRVISPLKKSRGVSRIVYRFDGDTLVIDQGECNVHRQVSLQGRWTRIKGKSLP